MNDDPFLNIDYLNSLISRHLSNGDTATIGDFLMTINREDLITLSIYKNTRPAFEKRLTRITIGKVLKRDTYTHDKQRENDLMKFFSAA